MNNFEIYLEQRATSWIKYSTKCSIVVSFLLMNRTTHGRVHVRLHHARKHLNNVGNDELEQYAVQSETSREECKVQPMIDMSYLNSEASQGAGSHTCSAYKDVCIDQKSYILYGHEYSNPNKGTNMPDFDVRDLKVSPHR